MQATQHAACRMRVSVLERRGRSGSKFKVAGAMVLPGASRRVLPCAALQSLPLRSPALPLPDCPPAAGTNEFNGKDRLEVVVPQMFEGRSFDGKVERMTNEDP